MARVTIQPAFITSTNQRTSKDIRDELFRRVTAGDPAFDAIFITAVFPIDTNDVYTYSVTTVFDLMYYFIIGTMGVAYVAFIGFVIYKIVEAHQYAKVERRNRAAEKEERKNRRDAMRRAGKLDADMDDDDEDNQQIDTSRFDEIGGDGEDDDGPGDYVRDEDGLAIKSLAHDVAHMLEDENFGGGIRFSPGSRRSAGGRDNSKLIEEMNRMTLPPPSAYQSTKRAVVNDYEL